IAGVDGTPLLGEFWGLLFLVAIAVTAVGGRFTTARRQVGSAGTTVTFEGTRDGLDRLGELTRDHEERAVVAVGEVGQGLKVLIGQHLRIGVVAVNGLEDSLHGLRLTIGAQNLGLLRALRLENLL